MILLPNITEEGSVHNNYIYRSSININYKSHSMYQNIYCVYRSFARSNNIRKLQYSSILCMAKLKEYNESLIKNILE
jgi:hypothetical protein